MSGDITISIKRQLGEPFNVTVGADSTVSALKRALQAPTTQPW